MRRSGEHDRGHGIADAREKVGVIGGRCAPICCGLGRRIYRSFQRSRTGQRSATQTTVAVANWIVVTASETMLRQRRATVPAEAVAILIGASAAGALHACPPARNRTAVYYETLDKGPVSPRGQILACGRLNPR